MWGRLSLRKENRESGLWIVKAYLGDHLISEKKFLVADSRSQLGLLEQELSARGMRLGGNNFLQDAPGHKPKYNIRANENQFKIAVVEFQCIGINEDKHFLGKMISELFTTEIVNGEAFKIIEREQLKKVVDEIAIGQSGIIDTSEAQQLGKLLGADAIIAGSVMKLQHELRVDSRIIEVKTGIIVSAESKMCKEDLWDISNKVAEMTGSLAEKFYLKNQANQK